MVIDCLKVDCENGKTSWSLRDRLTEIGGFCLCGEGRQKYPESLNQNPEEIL
jgi:hypothetical protein